MRVKLTLELPAGYKWIACQPYGTWMAFKRKPKVVLDRCVGDGSVAYYWGIQNDEVELCDFGPQTQGKAWRKTLRRIKR